MIICVDFDGTVCDHRYPEIGREALGATRWLQRWVELGAKLILFTMRHDNEKDGPVLSDAVKWFESRGIPLWGINENPDQHIWSESRKVYAQLYVDDAALGCPLLQRPGFNRPHVDWSVVGPEVEKRLLEDSMK
jgi:hypothetical protein